MKILVSACLLGKNCKYNGGNNYSLKLEEYLKNNRDYEVVSFCPEMLGNLGCPREPIEYVNGTIIDKNGKDYKNNMIKSKTKIQEILDNTDFGLAICKAKSPSCGSNGIYDGSFTKTLVNKDGYAVELIKQKGIKVITENDL